MSSMDASSAMELLDRIAATSSRNDKEILVMNVATDPFMRRVFKQAYDPFITYGITPPQVYRHGSDARRLTLGPECDDIWKMLADLAERSLTGNAAATAVKTTMEMLDARSAELLWRILSKDLRCGITEKTIAKMAPGILTVFNVMLSHKYERKRIKHFPVGIEPKLDGLRAPCMVRNGEAKFYSRVGNHFPALDVLGPAVVEMVKKAHFYLTTIEREYGSPAAAFYEMLGGLHGPSIALEGEALGGLFAETIGAVRKNGSAVEYHIFDAVPYEFMAKSDLTVFERPHWQRRIFIEFLFGYAPKDGPLRLVPRRSAASHDEIDTIFEEYRATLLSDYLAQGDAELATEIRKATGDKTLEGAIVKPLDGIYQKKRSHSQLKMKAEETEDLRVVGAFEGEGKYAGKLGGLIVDRNGIEVRVGGGFSDVQREEIWNDQPAYIGRLMEVEYHEVTPDGSLRHPRFKRWRDDKDEALRVAAE